MKKKSLQITFVAILVSLYLGTVFTGLICPLVEKDEDFRMVLEINDLTTVCLHYSNVIIAINSVDSIICESTRCHLSENVPKFISAIKVLLESDALRYEFTLNQNQVMNLTLGNYTAQWSCRDHNLSFSCEVKKKVDGPNCHWNYSSPLPSSWSVNTTISFKLVCDNMVYATTEYYDDDNDPFEIEFLGMLNDDDGSEVRMMNAKLIRNFVGEYKFAAKIFNSAGGISLIAISIDVFNKTVFKKFYQAFVFENQRINESVTYIEPLTVSSDANLNFNITEGNTDNIFSISRNGTVTIVDTLSLVTRELYELKIQISDLKSHLETMTELRIQLLPVCNLTFWNPHWCPKLHLNATVGKLKCLELIKFLVSPNITTKDDDNFNSSLSVDDKGNVLLSVVGSCLYNLSLNIIISYRNYDTNFTLMVLTQSFKDCKGLCIQGNESNQSPLASYVFEECGKQCIVSTESTMEINTTQKAKKETIIQVSTEISVFHTTTTKIYSFGDFYFSGNISGNTGNLFALKKNDGELQLFLAQELSEDDIGSYLLTLTISDANEIRKYNLNVTVKGSQMCDKLVFLNRSQTGKDDELYKINCSILLNVTNAEIEYKLLKSGNLHLQIVDDSIRLLQELPSNITNFIIAVSATYRNVTQYAMFDFLVKENCPHRKESDAVVFKVTFTENFYKASCPNDVSCGDILRYCQKNATWGPYTLKNCSIQDLSLAVDLAKNLKSSSMNMSLVENIFEIVNFTLNKYPALGSKNITDILYIMTIVGNVFRESQAAMQIFTLENVISIYDHLFSINTLTWNDTENEAAAVLTSMECFASAAIKSFTKAIQNSTIVKNNIAIMLSAFSDTIEYDSTRQKSWINKTVDKVSLPKDSIAGSFNYSIILYKNLADSIKLNTSLQEKYNEAELLLNKTINSRIISISITDGRVISKPVKITMGYLNNSYSEPICIFLNASISEGGLWSTNGCTIESVTKDYVTCSCTHLTNFAVLMSPVGMLNDSKALSIISIVGCSISLTCLVLTVITYCILWKYMKNDRSILHLNVSLCLLIGYTVFLSGIDRTDNKVGCIIVAALLHFIFLSVHFIMLAEGIEIVKSISFIFTAKSLLRYLLVGAYGIPILIVCISLAITQSHGYGNNHYCWLSLTDGLLWTFVGPVLIVFLVNLIIMIAVIKTMQTTQAFKGKTFPYKIKSAIRSVCILSPILGLAWIFGVLSVNKESEVFQYLFAIFNSLQRLFIFIFQCVLQHKVKDRLKEIFHKYKAQSLDSGQKLASTTKSAQEYAHSFQSKSYNVIQSKDASKMAYNVCIFDNAVYKNQSDIYKSNQEEVTSKSCADVSHCCNSAAELERENNI